MALDTNFVVGINLNDYFVDKDTGLPLAGGKIYFKKDNNRSVGKYAYMLTGSPPNYTYTPLPNPVTLSSVGTVAVSPTDDTNVAVYFYPYDEEGNLDLYFIQVTDSEGISGGNIQLERQAWPNVSANTNPLGSVSGETDNQITNPQFSDVFFLQEEGTLLEWTGAITNQVFPIAPGWDLIVSASDTASIQVDRLELAGSLNINTNPPYALAVLPLGADISSIKLRQTLNFNPSIWANNTLSGFMLVSSLDSISHSVEMTYTTSVPNVPKTILTASTGTTGYVSAAGTLDIGASLNTDAPPAGVTYIDVLLPRTGYVAVSSIQVLPIAENSVPAAYIQDSINKQQSDLFYYYNPLIQQVPVPSISEGWDFRVNPSQWGSTSAMGAVASQYLWDQLIGWQSVNSSITASRLSPRALSIDRSTTNQFALIQYISGTQLRQLLSNDFSVLIRAYTTLVAGASGTVSFWATADSTLPNVAPGTNLSLISTIDANGKPATFNGNWTEIPRSYRGEARFTIPYGTEMQDIPLEGWNRTTRDLDATYTYAAIVIGFSSAPASGIGFESISVTPGLLARPYAPLSYDLTLAQMQYYYEKTYDPDVDPGTVTTSSCLIAPCIFGHNTTDYVMFATLFGWQYKQVKCALPNHTLYSVLAVTPSRVNLLLESPAGTPVINSTFTSASWTLTNGKTAASYYPNTASPLESITTSQQNSAQGFIRWNATLDARYGIVL